MKDYQAEFIAFALENEVLRFGKFTLKSGRNSPYFFNAGLFNTGEAMLKLSQFFAKSMQSSGIEFDVLFGPAYKGITLSCGAAMALSQLTQQPIPFAFNRKEKKNHGEGGNMVGAKLSGKIAIIDDVITAGTAIRESFEIIDAHNVDGNSAQAAAVFIALDRQEKGQKEGVPTATSAIQQVEDEYGIPVVAIATMANLIEYLESQPQTNITKQNLAAMLAYREAYGI